MFACGVCCGKLRTDGDASDAAGGRKQGEYEQEEQKRGAAVHRLCISSNPEMQCRCRLTPTCWLLLMLVQALQSPDAPAQVMQQARDALLQAVTAAAQEAAASATQRAEHHCCGEPGCEHTHHAHKHGGCEEGQRADEPEDGNPSKTQGKKADAQTAGAGSNAAAEAAQGFSFNFEL